MKHLFPDIPTRTDKIYHDVIVEDSKPIKQHPYRMNPLKQKYLQDEVKYLLENDFIEPSQSNYSSPCILVPKSNGTYRMCTDYRKVNSVTKTDSFPIPRIDDCIDKVGNSKYVTKFDLLKGFWQVSLTDRANEVSTFFYSKLSVSVQSYAVWDEKFSCNVSATCKQCYMRIRWP